MSKKRTAIQSNLSLVTAQITEKLLAFQRWLLLIGLNYSVLTEIKGRKFGIMDKWLPIGEGSNVMICGEANKEIWYHGQMFAYERWSFIRSVQS